MSDRSQWFVSTEWLASHLADPDVAIVDGTWHLATTGRNGRVGASCELDAVNRVQPSGPHDR